MGDPSAPATRIALCGRVRVEIEGREVTPPTGQAALVFSFLMARPDLSATREELGAARAAERLRGGC